MTTTSLARGYPSARAFIISSIVFFVITTLVGLLVALKFIWPELMGNVEWLTFGRLRPLHTNGVLFGWLLAADMGICFYIVPRLCGVPLWSEKLGLATVALFDLVVLGAVVTLLAGANQGLEYAELPFVLDVGVVVAWVMFGLNIFATIAVRRHRRIYVSLWYIMGAIIWTAFVYITGNFTVLFTTGIDQANLNWFYVHNAVGLIFTPLGLAIAYYFIPKAARRPLYSHKLSMVGFWSISFIYVWTGAHHMIHGPISQWLQTVAILFSVMLMIPVWTVVWNFYGTVAGFWDRVREEPILKFLMAGTTFYVLTCFQGPMHSLRTVNAIVSKTDWIVGHAHMAVLGAFSFFAIAGCLYAVPRIMGKKLHSTSLANTTFWLMLVGGLLYFVSLWIGGFTQGLQWNDASIPFIDTVIYQRPYWMVRILGGLLIFIGVVFFFFNMIRTLTGEVHEYERDPEVTTPVPDADAGFLHRLDFSSVGVAVGALLLFFVGGLFTTLLPSLVEDSWARPINDEVAYSDLEQQGRDIYVREGCWYCHTQQVRTLESDVKRYGWRGVDAPISLPGEYTEDSPHLLGTRRTGPDLARVGGKYSTDWHKSHFNNPRDQVPGSVMPPFPWLTQDPQEFQAIVAYIQKLGRARHWRPDDDYEQ